MRDLTLWDLEINGNGHISVDGLDTVDLVERHHSPLLVVHRKRLEKDAREIKATLERVAPGSKVLYSYKTNCVPGILKEIHRLGIGAEVISPYELWLAETLGVPGEMIVYNGVDKTDESIRQAVRLGILAINVDHLEEIDRINRVARELNRKVQVGIRLGLVHGSHFGLDPENGEASEACRRITGCSDYLDLACIHFNVTSNAKSSCVHKAHLLRALEFMRHIKDSLGMSVPYLDIGGGFGVPTTKNMSPSEYALYRLSGALPKPPRLKDFQGIASFLTDIATTIVSSCRSFNLQPPTILIEPGRFVSSRSEFLLTKINAVKCRENGAQFVLTDAGRLSLTFPCDFEYHEVFVANRPKDQLRQCYHVMGRVCTSADWMMKNRFLPELRNTDILAVMDAGAYFSSYSTNFAFPRPAIVMVADGGVKVIRKRETFEHLTAMDRL